MARAPGLCRTVTEMSRICNHKKPIFSVFLSYENSLVMPALLHFILINDRCLIFSTRHGFIFGSLSCLYYEPC